MQIMARNNLFGCFFFLGKFLQWKFQTNGAVKRVFFLMNDKKSSEKWYEKNKEIDSQRNEKRTNWNICRPTSNISV